MSQADISIMGDLAATYVEGNVMKRIDQVIGKKSHCIIVVPTNRPERIEAFLKAWAPIWNYPGGPELYIIEDTAKSFPLDVCGLNVRIHIYTHAVIDDDLGERGVCIDRFSPGVRSYGIWKAAQAKPDMIWTTDDDCMPLDGQDAVSGHRDILFGDRTIPQSWHALQSFSQSGISVLHRGYPFASDQRIGKHPILNHGLVAGMPDIDAVTQLEVGTFNALAVTSNVEVPRGYYFPMSIQNVAFKPGIAPLMYLPKLPDGMKRWSDIWCGLVMKKVCDAHSLPVTSGAPCVLHERASNVFANLKQEWAGYEVNERLWKVIDAVDLSNIPQVPYTQGALVDDYLCVVEAIGAEFPELAIMVEGMRGWARLWT